MAELSFSTRPCSVPLTDKTNFTLLKQEEPKVIHSDSEDEPLIKEYLAVCSNNFPDPNSMKKLSF